jgi:RNA polymerase sigma-70 factor, ECF subfamily
VGPGFWEHVAALPRPQRDVVALRYVLDLPVLEIAQIVERPEGTVKSDLSRARTRLRQLMEPDAERDDVDREAAT